MPDGSNNYSSKSSDSTSFVGTFWKCVCFLSPLAKSHFSVFFPLFSLLSCNVLSGGETPDPKMAHHCNWEKRVGFCFFASDFLELMSCVSPLSSGQRCFLCLFSCLH